ncbi:TPA: RidA family protein [Photobacterium damselae]|uniref:Reactive intermediate deaminase TdcF n=2 Tax=Photobacterium damselae TaxID=38293 RepID=A0A1V1VCN9_PHODP|nr:RidA family protein [Photobacterium damselae]EJN6959203.1 RidA family protein [Photobacterium damselae]MBE8127456.1 RidA family protein [Photobacterium damselae subsp. piscicida]MCG3845930.1 RidA family protein [Photobacterium damselae]MCG9777793.1 RidA family protein [Photobacterium damselae]MDP2545115.1 RidA family protein [Photobacterium damselae subsp. piscicida]
MKTIITANKAPEAIGPYSHGNAFGDLIFTSGQLPVCKEKGGVVDGGISEQSRQSLLNLQYVLQAAGGDMETVLKTTCYLSDINDFAAFNEVYKEFFKTDCPARSCFAVKDLPLGVKIEVEAIACRK